jgi:hypothetical protein
MPESLDPAEAAPLLCAGITTFNALRHSGAMPGDLVAVEGIGGLGYLGVQFASKFGYRVVAISRGKVDSGKQGPSGLGVGDSYGFGGHLAVCGDDGRACDDRKVSAGEGERGVSADGERESAVSRGAHHIGEHVSVKLLVQLDGAWISIKCGRLY